MIKQTLTFDDHFNGGKITEDWYFNLDVGEVAEMMMVEGDDLQAKLKQIGESQDKKQIFGFFKEMLTLSVGKPVTLENGRTVFRKTTDTREEFFGGGAYSSFFMQLITDEQLAANFINSIMPADLKEQAEKLAEKAAASGDPEVLAQLKAAGLDVPTPTPPSTDEASDEELRRLLDEDEPVKELEDNSPAWLKEGRKPSKSELVGMPREELQLAMRLKAEGKLK